MEDSVYLVRTGFNGILVNKLDSSADLVQTGATLTIKRISKRMATDVSQIKAVLYS